jgi:hypothetical protein
MHRVPVVPVVLHKMGQQILQMEVSCFKEAVVNEDTRWYLSTWTVSWNAAIQHPVHGRAGLELPSRACRTAGVSCCF